jgi:pyridoxal biosynthesis lyase PdxS
MALERVPADIRSQGGVARMSDPQMIKEIMDTVTIPVMAKARIGHFVECQVHMPLVSPRFASAASLTTPVPRRSSKPSA